MIIHWPWTPLLKLTSNVKSHLKNLASQPVSLFLLLWSHKILGVSLLPNYYHCTIVIHFPVCLSTSTSIFWFDWNQKSCSIFYYFTSQPLINNSECKKKKKRRRRRSNLFSYHVPFVAKVLYILAAASPSGSSSLSIT